MNTVVLVLLTLCVVTIRAHEESDTNTIKHKYLYYYHAMKKEYVTSVSKKIEERCHKISDKIEHADRIFDECVNEIDDSLTLCGSAKQLLLNCTQFYFEIADACLPQHAKGLSHFFVKSVHSVVDYLCIQTGETLLEFFNPCVWESLDTPEVKKCSEEAQGICAKYLQNIPSTNEVCSDVIGLRRCYEKLVAKCKNPITKRVHIGFHEALVSSC